jgi:hypothetical protein
VDLTGKGQYKANSGTRVFKDSSLSETAAATCYVTGDQFQRNPMFAGLRGDFIATAADADNALRAAKTKALNDLADAKAGMGENLATAVQTADMFLNAGADIIRAAIAIKKGNLFQAIKRLNVKDLSKAVKSGKIPNSAANRWLEYWYGWKPLAQDVYGLYELLQERLEPALLVHGRGQGRYTFTGGFTGTRSGSTHPPYHFSEYSPLVCRCNLTGRVDSADYLRTINRVGLLNPVGLAWDLIPFSFVVDWVYPIGDVAHGLSATAGLSFVGGHTTARYERSVKAVVAPGYTVEGSASPQMLIETFGFNRTKLTSFPRPVTYMRSPFTGSSRIATVLALITKLGPRGLN